MSALLKIASPLELAPFIDHTLLKADARKEDVRRFCQEAITYGFKAVCANSCFIPVVTETLRGHSPVPCSVVGFPLGAMACDIKVAETRWVVEHGAQEIDMVINIGALREGAPEIVRDEIAAVKRACGNKLLKVIIETALLTDKEKVEASRLSKEGGADFIKTSTGFSHSGATVHDVALIRETVGDAIGVKASGGIRTFADAMMMIGAGANRIGASASVAIISN